MKTLLFFILFIQFTFASAQEVDKPNKIPLHVISLESGIKSRGLIGIGYTISAPSKSDLCFYSLHGSIGYGGVSPNFFFTVAPTLNIGSDNTYFQLGLEAKYLTTFYYEKIGAILDFDSPKTFSGPALGGFIGVNLFSKNKVKENFKIRLSYLIGADITKTDDFQSTDKKTYFTRLGLGISFGLSRNKKGYF